jgi:predicted nucleic acid-binding protein
LTPKSSDETSTLSLIRALNRVPDQRVARGVLDTSVVIDLDTIDISMLPLEIAVTALTMAELAAGPHATTEPAERARRQDRLQRTEAAFSPLPFDANAARAYGRIYAAVATADRKSRGARAVDLMIAAIACSVGLPLYTRNPSDFTALNGLVDIVAI